MAETFEAEQINIGYHPDGYRIDKTTDPLNKYTKWEIGPDGDWKAGKPVCFHSMPENGWIKTDKFEWD